MRARSSGPSPKALGVGAGVLVLALTTVVGISALGPSEDGPSEGPPAGGRSALEPAGGDHAAVAAGPARPAGARAVPSSAPADPARTPPAAVTAVLAAPDDPSVARAALEQLLAARSLAQTRLLRTGLQDDTGVTDGAAAALRSDVDDIAAVARVLAGSSLAQRVRQGFADQSAASLAYARAVRDADTAAADRARAQMAASSRRLGAALSLISTDGVRADVPGHDAGQLRAYVDAVARGDEPEAYAVDRALQARRSREGAALATGVPGHALAAASSAEQRLAARWQLLFGEHAARLADAVQAGRGGGPAPTGTAVALAESTGELTADVAEQLGPDHGPAFAARWAACTDAVLAYARAAAGGEREVARTGVSTAVDAVTTALTGASGGRLRPEHVRPALQRHGELLVRQADAVAAADWATAYAVATQDVTESAALAGRLAAALED